MPVGQFQDSKLQGPAGFATVVSPSDDTDLAAHSRGLYVGGAGDLTVIMACESNDATTTLFSAVPAGTVLPIRVRRVLDAGTDATLIVSLY
jgi:hypothetical protein